MKKTTRTSTSILTSSIVAAIALLSSNVQASVITQTFDLGTSPSGTMITGGVGGLIPWIAINTLPVGSFLQSFTILAKLEIAITDNWASDLCAYVDSNPGAPGTAAILEVGGYGSMGTVTTQIDWANGQNGAGTTANDTKTAGTDFPAGIDLSTAQLSVGNGYNDTPTWSGTISVTYTEVVPEPATAVLGGLAFGLLTLRRRQRNA